MCYEHAFVSGSGFSSTLGDVRFCLSDTDFEVIGKHAQSVLGPRCRTQSDTKSASFCSAQAVRGVLQWDYLEVLHNMLKQSAMVAILAVILTIGLSGFAPVSALTPRRSPEQLAQDEILFARASLSIEAAAIKCFSAPLTHQNRPIKIRFFLAGAGKQVSQLQLLEPRPASTAMRRAAFRAISACAPYVVPSELRNWGGFWATVTFR
jgi:hypothetical protein